MTFKKYQGAGFNLFIEGPAGTDGRKRETTVVSCRRQDLPDVLAALTEGEGWVETAESLVPPEYARKFERPSTGKKNFTILVKQSDYLRTVVLVPDQKTNGVSTSAPASQSLS